MTRPTRPSKPTLRGLAARLGVAHSGLSKLIHDRLLTAGVGFDARGHVVVTDIDAAAAQWNGIHKITTADLIRRDARSAAEARNCEASEEHDHAEYVARSVAGVLTTLLLLNRCDHKTLLADVDKRMAAIADLRSRFDAEIVAYTVDDESVDELAYFDHAVENALEYLADQSSLLEEDEQAPAKVKRTRKATK